MAKDLEALQKSYEELLQRLLPEIPVTIFHQRIQTRPTNNGDAHVEVVDGRFNYVVTERGSELRRRITSDSEELLYWLFDDATYSLCYKFRPSFLHRLLRKDPRRQRFDRHLELLERVNQEWAARKRLHYADVLRRYPYRSRA